MESLSDLDAHEDDFNKYKYIEENIICDICYNMNNEGFKCNRCTFISCSRCFNNFFFNEKNNCPICRF